MPECCQAIVVKAQVYRSEVATQPGIVVPQGQADVARSRVILPLLAIRGELMTQNDRVMDILCRAKRLAWEYYASTGKPLGITGKVAEYNAARLLSLHLAPTRTEGCDAIELNGNSPRRLQIKGHCILPNCKPGQHLGPVGVTEEWDIALVVLLDEDFDAIEMHEAERAAVMAAFAAPGSKARDECGRLSINPFKAIGKLRGLPPQQTEAEEE